MKLLITGDIHGSAYWAQRLCDIADAERPDKLVLLGDILYHGPRNDLPQDYAPKRVIELLNARKDTILAVRGNCDAEVDQMVLKFPMMADYATLWDSGHMMFFTHGHHVNEAALPPFASGDVLVHGHTHVRELRLCSHYAIVNPGSLSIPKGDGRPSYVIYENGAFTLKTPDDTILETLTLPARDKCEAAEGTNT